MRHRGWIVAALVPLLGACATKGDVRTLRTEVEALRESQREMLREIQRQNAALLDTITAQNTRTRGDVLHQLALVERQLTQVQELTGQGQQRLTELRAQLRTGETAGGSSAAAGDPEEIFSGAMESKRRKSLATARAGFEEILRSFPDHPRAPEALFYLAETFQEEGNPAAALEAYGRVLERYPRSPRAATALYRSGLVEAERGRPSEARAIFQRLRGTYPNAPEAALAGEQLKKLPR